MNTARASLFIDLVDSTAIAERIGATRFLAPMNEFIYAVGAALEGSDGVIDRSVGEEAIIPWRLDETRDLSRAVEVVFRLRAQIAAGGAEYRSRFGVVADFRAALHAGSVVAGEMGDGKLEIVLLGDTVNTKARTRPETRDGDRPPPDVLPIADDGARCETALHSPIVGERIKQMRAPSRGRRRHPRRSDSQSVQIAQ